MKRLAAVLSELTIPLIVAAVMLIYWNEARTYPAQDRVFIVPLLYTGAVFLALVLIKTALNLAAMFARKEKRDDDGRGGDGAVIAGMVLLMVAYLAGISTIGFFVSSFVFLVGSSIVSIGWSLKQAIVVAVTLVAMYLVTVQLLGMRLPTGLFL